MEVCRIGDAVQAIYQGNGKVYGAHIVHIAGNVITVNWNDGDPHHRQIDSKGVYKNAATCFSLTGKLNALIAVPDEDFICSCVWQVYIHAVKTSDSARNGRAH